MSGNAVGRPMEILLVEDSLQSATLTIGALKQGKIVHHLTWLQDGEDALEFLFKQGKFARAPRPDLVLLDLTLPHLDGREVLTRMRADERLKQVPVVIMTASTSDEDAAQTARLQVEGYILKPFDVQRFVALVQELKRFWHADLLVPKPPEDSPGDSLTEETESVE